MAPGIYILFTFYFHFFFLKFLFQLHLPENYQHWLFAGLICSPVPENLPTLAVYNQGIFKTPCRQEKDSTSFQHSPRETGTSRSSKFSECPPIFQSPFY